MGIHGDSMEFEGVLKEPLKFGVAGLRNERPLGTPFKISGPLCNDMRDLLCQGY